MLDPRAMRPGDTFSLDTFRDTSLHAFSHPSGERLVSACGRRFERWEVARAQHARPCQACAVAIEAKQGAA